MKTFSLMIKNFCRLSRKFLTIKATFYCVGISGFLQSAAEWRLVGAAGTLAILLVIGFMGWFNGSMGISFLAEDIAGIASFYAQSIFSGIAAWALFACEASGYTVFAVVAFSFWAASLLVDALSEVDPL